MLRRTEEESGVEEDKHGGKRWRLRRRRTDEGDTEWQVSPCLHAVYIKKADIVIIQY